MLRSLADLSAGRFVAIVENIRTSCLARPLRSVWRSTSLDKYNFDLAPEGLLDAPSYTCVDATHLIGETGNVKGHTITHEPHRL